MSPYVDNDEDYDPWPGNLPLILSGGGSRLGSYRRFFTDNIAEKLQPFTRWDSRNEDQGLEFIKMPVPREWDSHEDYEMFKGDFDRLSVAHGLAYGAENLPKITV